MAITSDSNVPAEVKEVFEKFNHAAEGHRVDHVLNAMTNFCVAAINRYCQEEGMGVQETAEFGAEIFRTMASILGKNVALRDPPH